MAGDDDEERPIEDQAILTALASAAIGVAGLFVNRWIKGQKNS